MTAASTPPVVFLLDVDNTLLDNDRIIVDLQRHLESEFGRARADQYWAAFEALRSELGYADYLGALQRYRLAVEGSDSDQQRLASLSGFLIDYPFAARLYPGALEVVDHLTRLGPTVILSDGDVVFQPRKIQRSGLWDAVGGRVLIYIHKEKTLVAMQRRYPTRHYVMVDDKLRILAAMKEVLQQRLTTVFVRQGHYALDPANVADHPAADVTRADWRPRRHRLRARAPSATARNLFQTNNVLNSEAYPALLHASPSFAVGATLGTLGFDLGTLHQEAPAPRSVSTCSTARAIPKRLSGWCKYRRPCARLERFYSQIRKTIKGAVGVPPVLW